jgi:hypothetical protein
MIYFQTQIHMRNLLFYHVSLSDRKVQEMFLIVILHFTTILANQKVPIFLSCITVQQFCALGDFGFVPTSQVHASC